MSNLVIVGQLLGGAALLWLAGEALVRGAARLALRAGLAPLAVGLTVVAFGTSSPELAVSLDAARRGLGDISIGNVVGSNICNIALILGLAALVRPLAVEVRALRVDIPLMVATSLVLLLVLADGAVGRFEGWALLAGIAGYVGLNLRLSREGLPSDVVAEMRRSGGRRALLRDASLVGGGLAGLYLGGGTFVAGASAAARSLGVSDAVIGLTVVAVGTSLPELATSVVAAARGQDAIAVGNVVGSNVFNILAIVGAAGVASPFRVVDIGATDLAVMVALAVLLTPLAWTGSRVDRAEGALLLASFVAFVVWRIWA